jgi:hypothetical protein
MGAARSCRGRVQQESRVCGATWPAIVLDWLAVAKLVRSRETADTADPLKRWDTDDRFTGVADASAFARPSRS